MNATFITVFSLLVFTPSLASKWPQTAATLSEQWQSQYLSAKEDSESHPSLACKKYTSLSQQLGFPLRKLAFLRSLTLCPDREKMAWQDVEKYIDSPWLKESLAQVHYSSLKKNEKYFEAYEFDKSEPLVNLHRAERVQLLLSALEKKNSKERTKVLREKLEILAPRFRKNFPDNKALAVAKDYRNIRDFKNANRIYDKIIQEKNFGLVQKWQAYRGKRKTFKLRRWELNKKYIESSKKWAQFLTNDFKKSKKLTEYYHRANIEYVRTLWTEKNQKSALAALDTLEKNLQKRYSHQTIYWLRAKMAEEKENYPQTIFWLKKALDEAQVSSAQKEKILWNLGWNLRRQKKYSESNSFLQKLMGKKSLSPHALTKYIYWSARNHQDNKEKEKSKSLYQKIIDVDSYGFYGALAHRALEIPFAKPENKSFTNAELWSLFKGREDYQIFNWLVDVQEPQVAQSFLKDRLKSRRGWSPKNWAQYLVLMQKSGNFLGFFKTFHSLKPYLQKKVGELVPSIMYPTPYKDLVAQAEKKSGVEASLIYSIMKQESGFNPRARSFADAFGLMQLIPQVAKKMAVAAALSEYTKAEDLYRPEVNIPLGSETLRSLFKDFNNQFILSVASYNASQKATKGWVKSRFRGDPLTFIEDIPYAETKGYVKLVLRNYISYNRFLSPDDKQQFPEHCLSGLEAFL